MNGSLSVHSLHALAYCERLFFLEEVERLRVADERVYAGRTLHVEIERDEEDENGWNLSNVNLAEAEFLHEELGRAIARQKERGFPKPAPDLEAAKLPPPMMAD